MRDTVVYILDRILDNNPTTVEETDDNGYVTITIHAPKDVMGKVIGKGGKTVNAIKNIVKIQAIKDGKKVDIQVAEKN